MVNATNGENDNLAMQEDATIENVMNQERVVKRSIDKKDYATAC